MTQTTPTISADQSGLAYRTADNNGKKALLNHHKGATAPTYAEAGILWLDDAATPWLLKIYDGTDWIVIGAVNSTANTLEVYHGAAALRVLNHATDTGAANAYVVAPVPAITAYATGQIVTLRPVNANTGAATININGLGVKNIKLLDGNDPAANALLATGIYTLVYDGTNFVLLNQSLSLPPAVPAGSVMSYAGATEPSGWIFCYGQEISRTTYAALFTAVGTVYGTGDGSTTFNVPDIRGRAVAGQDDMGGVSANRLTGLGGGVDGDILGGVGGEEAHVLTSGEHASHTHSGSGLTTTSDGAHTHTVTAVGSGSLVVANTPGSSAAGSSSLTTSSTGAHTHSVSGTTGSSGSGTAHNNVQPTIILNYIIKT